MENVPTVAPTEFAILANPTQAAALVPKLNCAKAMVLRMYGKPVALAATVATSTAALNKHTAISALRTRNVAQEQLFKSVPRQAQATNGAHSKIAQTAVTIQEAPTTANAQEDVSAVSVGAPETTYTSATQEQTPCLKYALTVVRMEAVAQASNHRTVSQTVARMAGQDLRNPSAIVRTVAM